MYTNWLIIFVKYPEVGNATQVPAAIITSVFSNSKYGFIKGRSTVLQLLKILDDWTNNLDQGKQIDVIYVTKMHPYP